MNLDGIVLERDNIAPDPILGALCDRQEDALSSGGCYHDSCQNIDANGRITFAEGPLCGEIAYLGDCNHDSCGLIEPAQAYCLKHDWQIVVSCGSGRGFAGGNIYWAMLACDCMDMDESDDIRAAY